MQPEIHLGPLTLQTFGIMFACGFLAAGLLVAQAPEGARQAGRLGLRDDLRGARRRDRRLAARLHHRELRRRSPTTCSATSSPARGWSGTAARSAGAIGVVLWARWRRMLNLTLLDICAPGLAIGYAIGRIGCQLSGDGDYGIPWDGPWAMAYPDGTVPTDVTGPPDADLRDACDGDGHLRPLAPADALPARVCCSPSTSSSPGVERFLIEFIRRNDDVAARSHPGPAAERRDDRSPAAPG